MCKYANIYSQFWIDSTGPYSFYLRSNKTLTELGAIVDDPSNLRGTWKVQSLNPLHSHEKQMYWCPCLSVGRFSDDKSLQEMDEGHFLFDDWKTHSDADSRPGAEWHPSQRVSLAFFQKSRKYQCTWADCIHTVLIQIFYRMLNERRLIFKKTTSKYYTVRVEIEQRHRPKSLCRNGWSKRRRRPSIPRVLAVSLPLSLPTCIISLRLCKIWRFLFHVSRKILLADLNVQ